MQNFPHLTTCMILAAGRGSRMRELTNDRPKPMIEIHQKPLLGHLIDKIQSFGMQKIVVNTCYKGEMIRTFLQNTPRLQFSNEKSALETGGGIKKALPLLMPEGENGFFVCNADALWDEPTIPMLNALEKEWNPDKYDILLAVIPKTNAFGHIKKGDYFIEQNKLRRVKPEEKSAPYLFTGVQIMHPRVFNHIADKVFSSALLYDLAQKKGRLGYIVFDGRWFHVGTPEAVIETEKLYDIYD